MATKKKRMTLKEKAARAECKKRLQADGIIPPNKLRLNRKRFAKEVWAEYTEVMTEYEDWLYLRRAIGLMVSENMREVSAEAVGVLKVLKLAVESKKFENALRAEGRSTYNIEEYIKTVVFPITDL